MTAPASARCEETDALELLVKVNAGAPLVERMDDLNPNAPPVVFVQVPVAIEAIQAAYLLGYEAGHAMAQTRPDPPSIVCPFCGARSHHPRDIHEKYCGRCHRFHDDPPSGEINRR